MSIELAEVFRQHAPSYLARYGRKILPGHRRVIASVMACRTPALGGQAWRCEDCAKTHYSYHSCNNRHCPKCGNDDATDWLERQRSLLLPVPHFLVTFTVPEELRAWLRSNQKTGYNLLMRCAAAAMEALCADPRHLGARPGLIAILHTWSRKLVHHPHVHLLVPAGGFDAKGERWIHSRDGYFLPSKALAASVRGRMKAALGKLEHLAAIPEEVWSTAWVVDLQAAGSGEQALQYLARYVFRTALGGKKIVSCGDNHVTFRYTDSTTKKEETETLEPHAFLARYLQHVLPKGFTRIRYYGLFAPGNRKHLGTVRRILRCPKDEPGERPETSSLPKPFCCPDLPKTDATRTASVSAASNPSSIGTGMFIRDPSQPSNSESIHVSDTLPFVSPSKNDVIFRGKFDDQPPPGVVRERLIPKREAIQPACSISPRERWRKRHIGRSQPFAYSAKEPRPSF